MKAFIAIIVGITAGAVLAEASGCHAVVVHRGFGHHYVAPVVHHAAVYTPYPVYAVGASYAGHDNSVPILKGQLEAVAQSNSAIVMQNQILLSLLQNNGLKLPPQAEKILTPPQKSLPTDSGLVLIQNNCAACHTGAKAKAKLMIFEDDGKPNSKLTAEQMGSIIGRVMTDDPATVMPPLDSNKSPSDADRRKMVALFVGSPKK